MCLSSSNIRAAAQWNWEGDTIVHEPIILAWRKVPETDKRFDMDIRGFISSKDNSVIRRVVSEIAGGLPEDKRALFLSRGPHSFDLRMRAVTAYISKNISYEPRQRRFDHWMFPEETLKKRSGDCEDRAFLLASLLLASGVSSYMVRVALGKIYNQKTKHSHDHVWVMYKNESGVWMLIEPLLYTEQAKKHSTLIAGKRASVPEETVEYIPYFVFNDTHLWQMKNNTIDTSFLDYIGSRKFWKKFDPEFAAGVHNHIFDEALPELDQSDLLYTKGVSLAMDINPAIYDPRDHFDNSYIDEGWELVDRRIKEGTLDGLAKAAHAAADFYAHSSYGYFAKKKNGKLIPYDPENPDACFANPPDYAAGDFDLADGGKFSVNESKCRNLRDVIMKNWQGKIVSGRFAQPGDQEQGFFEKVFISIPYALRKADNFSKRTCLPHHNEIAMDNEKKPDGHKLYNDPAKFKEAFRQRRDTAVAHIKNLYAAWNGK